MSSPCERFTGVPSPIAKCQSCGFARKDHAPAALAPAAAAAAAAAPAVPQKRVSVSDATPPAVAARPQSVSVSGPVAAAAAAAAAVSSASSVAAASLATHIASSAPQVAAAAVSVASSAASASDAALVELNSRLAAAEAKISQAKKAVDETSASIAAIAAQPVTWKEYKDDDGRTYFYNTASAESVWEIPPEHAKILSEKKRLEKLKIDAQKEFEAARSALEKVASEKSAAVKAAAAESARIALEQTKATVAASAAASVAATSAASSFVSSAVSSSTVAAANISAASASISASASSVASAISTAATAVKPANNVWQEFKDDEGRTYYYNKETKESSWSIPAEFLKPKVAPPAVAPRPASTASGSAVTGEGAPVREPPAVVARPVAATASSDAYSSVASVSPDYTLDSTALPIAAPFSSKFAYDNKAVWLNATFLDMCYDSYMNHKQNSVARSSFCASATMLTSVLAQMQQQCQLWFVGLPNDLRKDLQDVQSALVVLNELSNQVPASIEAKYTDDKTCDFMFALKMRISTLAPGGFTLFPSGWINSDGSSQPILFCIHRQQDTPEFCTVCVINSGSQGLSYHPIKFETDTNQKYKLSFIFHDVPFAKISDGAFWFMIARFTANPHETHTASLFYEQLLPFLNMRSIRSNLADNVKPNRNGVPWAIAPRSGDNSLIWCILYGIYSALFLRGWTEPQIKYFELLIRWQFCRIAVHDFEADIVNISDSDRFTVRMCIKELMAESSRLSQDESLCVTSPSLLRQMQQFSEQVMQKINDVIDVENVPLVLKNSDEENLKGADDCSADYMPFPLFDGFDRTESIEGLAGPADLDKNFRPVQFSLIKDAFLSFEDIACGLRHCDHICTLLAYQKDAVKNTSCLSIALIQYIFTHSMPLPLARGHPKLAQCLWQQPIRYETQIDILRLLHTVARHFITCALSLRYTRSFDATRILITATMTMVADACVRMRASDIPSFFSLHYNGTAAPTPRFFIKPFGIDVSSFIVLSEGMKFQMPHLVATRTAVLDYFVALKRDVSPDRYMFNFEHSPLPAAEIFLCDQLCFEFGFPNDPSILPLYVTGQRSELPDLFPELHVLRDIVFYFKLMMTPTSDELPEVRVWLHSDSKLKIKFKDPKEGYVVTAFGKTLKVLAALSTEEMQAQQSALSKIFFGKKRGWTSGADPSDLAGTEINCEEDVLHVKTMPSFDNRLSQRASEQLICFLTAPYIRIPLVLGLFSARENISALGHKQIQLIIDAVLFEPWLWQPDVPKVVPKEIPCSDRAHLATPMGLLFNELQKSPQGIVIAISELVNFALELDTGRYSESTASIILYVIRLVVRVEGFMRFLSDHNNWDKSCVVGAGPQSHLRGLECTPEKLQLIESRRKEIRAALDDCFFPLLERWAEYASKNDEMKTCVLMHAHLAYLYLHKPFHEYNRQICVTLLSSQIFLKCWFSYPLEAVGDMSYPRTAKEQSLDTFELSSELQITDTDLFALFQMQRGNCIRWITSSPFEGSECLESIVRIVTMTGKRLKSAADTQTRFWRSMDGLRCIGRFIPEPKPRSPEEAAAAEQKRDNIRATEQPDIEINAQLGTFSVQNARLEALDDKVGTHPDFLDLFGENGRLMQCAIMKISANRYWVRLVGRRHDIQFWKQDNRSPPLPFSRMYDKTQLQGSEQWISDIFDSIREKHHILQGVTIYMPKTPYGSNAPYARLCAHHITDDDPESMKEPPKKLAELCYLCGVKFTMTKHRHHCRICGNSICDTCGTDSKKEIVASGIRAPNGEIPSRLCTTCLTSYKPRMNLKEVVVYRTQKVVHVYMVEERGRRFYRRLCFSSDFGFSFHALPPVFDASNEDAYFSETDSTAAASVRRDGSYDYIRPIPPKESLVVTRNFGLSTADSQMSVPRKFLEGLIPDALIENYVFWQNQHDDSLTGYMLRSVAEKTQTAFALRIKLCSDGTNPTCAQVLRVPLQALGTTSNMSPLASANAQYAEEKKVPENPPGQLMLINIRDAVVGTFLHQLSRLCFRLEDPSYVLVWSNTVVNAKDVRAKVSIDLIEFPRLGLSFSAQKNAGQTRFMSNDFVGMFISDFRSAAIMKTVQGLPHGLVLENIDREFAIMVPAVLPTRIRPADPVKFNIRLVFFRQLQQESLSKLLVKTYLYPVHISSSFLFTPTQPSTAYLLLLRFISRQYEAVCTLVESCVNDSGFSDEMKGIFNALRTVSDDQSPDAHACRLKISLVMEESGTSEVDLPWTVFSEYGQYLFKEHAISASCKLTPPEELRVLEICGLGDPPNYKLVTRKNILKTYLFGGDSVQVHYPKRPDLSHEFDALVDKACIQPGGWDSLVSTFASISYKKPLESSGLEMVRQMNKWYNNGFRLKGGKDDLGFLFVWELLTGTVQCKLQPGDNTFYLGCLIMRLFPSEDTAGTSLLMSMLKVVARNLKIVSDPTFPKVGSVGKMASMFKMGDNAFSRLIKESQPWFSKNQSQLDFGDQYAKDVWDPPSSISTGFSSGRARFKRQMISDYDCNVRFIRSFSFATRGGTFELTQNDVEVFAKDTLAPIDLPSFIVEQNRQQLGMDPVSDEIPFNIAKHPSCKSHVADSLLSRLTSDCKFYANQTNNATEFKFKTCLDADVDRIVAEPAGAATVAALKQVERLIQVLGNLAASDQKYVSFATEYLAPNALSIGSSVDAPHAKERLSYILGCYGLVRMPMTNEFLITMLLSSCAESDLRYLNPYLSDKDCEMLMNTVISTLVRVIRIGHIRRCITEAKELFSILRWIQNTSAATVDASVKTKLSLRASAVAALLSAKRSYTEKHALGYSFDPRFMVFEFLHNLMLRGSQVQLVRDFCSAIASGEGGSCHQLIMGAGKTTVVGPLLALMLANGKSVVIQCQPRALLEQSRIIVRERFSALIRKRVYTFKFDRYKEINQALLRMFTMARDTRAVVVTTPTDIKAFMLKFVELMHCIDLSRKSAASNFNKFKQKAISEEALKKMRKQCHICTQILSIWKEGVLLMDEVDMILHPLKSELNFPVGLRQPLDLTTTKNNKGLRWEIPWFLMDALFFHSTEKLSVPLAEGSRQAQLVLAKIKAVIDEGMSQRLLQGTPHLVLLNRSFYDLKLRPLLAEWLVQWFSFQAKTKITNEQIFLYLSRPPSDDASSIFLKSIGVNDELVDDDFMKMLNLAYDLLTSFVPFVLSKIDRVTFGLLNEAEIEASKISDPTAPKSRSLTAIPFVGKDCPSERSEFAQPDVVISLTILAYRYEGLRRSDLRSVLKELQADLSEEQGSTQGRPSFKKFAQWVKMGGGRVRGVRKDVSEKRTGASVKDVDLSATPLVAKADEDLVEIWPLHLINLDDDEHFELAFKLLSRVPAVIHHYLTEDVFPEVMRHQGLKISSSGQELGGDLLFHRRLGFSGTPSDLLPLELGKCSYERGTDGLVLHFLTSQRIMSTFMAPQDWTVKSLLNKIATADPPYNALIDTGALITGMSNYEVAAYLLTHGLSWAQGVVFLDSSDKKMILCRDGMRIVPLATGSVSKEQRFAFYDQVHTTGMDIQHAPNAKAVLTLGKDMTFRDYAQGAFRMRGIGKGQTIELFIIPEVLKLVSDNLKAVGIKVTGEEDTVTMCKNVSAWLNINSCRSEGVQFNMLCEQNLRSVWRKVAFRRLTEHHALIGTDGTSVDLDDSVDVFRERLDFNVEASVPPVGNFGQRLDKLVKEHQKFIGDLEEGVIAHVKLLATYTKEELLKPITVEGSKGTTNADAQAGGDGVSASQTVAFNSEQQQEQEQEQEQTKEQEQLVQIELEEEAQIEGEEVPNKKKFSLKKQDSVPWNFDHLSKQANMDGKFYPCSNFEVYKEISSLLSTSKANKKLQFPPYLLMSENYFHRVWTLTSHRRLKNITVLLEWIPSASQIKLVPNSELEGVYDAPDRSQRLMRTFALHDANRDGSLNEAEIKSFSKVVNPLISSVDELNDYAKQLSVSLSAPFADVDKFMKTGSFMKVHKGRYYVAVELAEAESIRAIMHIREASSVIQGSDCEIALRVGPTLLDESKGFVRSPSIQTAVARQCFRFIDSDHYFDADVTGFLLNALHFSQPDMRAAFYDEVRTCRRRMQKDWNLTTAAKIIKTPDEYHHFEFESLISAVRVAIRNAGLKLLDAYRLFDLNHDGLLDCSEIYSGLLWAGMKDIKPDMVTSLVKHIDKTKDGRVRYRDFLIALNDPNELEEFVPEQELDITKVVIPLVKMPEIYTPPAAKSQQQIEIEGNALKHIKVKVRPVEDWVLVWETRGTEAKNDVSIWAPVLSGSFFKRNKKAICTGHYAVAGLGSGNSKPPKAIKGAMLIELTDKQTNTLSRSDVLDEQHVNFLMPHPVKYRKIWEKISGSNSDNGLYVWRPIPPSPEFCAIGVICTRTNDEPPLEACRCVNRGWLVNVSQKPIQVWDDVGFGGKKGSIWSSPSAIKCMSVLTDGQPLEFRDLKAAALMASDGFIKPADGAAVSRPASVSVTAAGSASRPVSVAAVPPK